MSNLQKLLSVLSQEDNATLLSGMLRGMEKESLRVTPEGSLAQTSHPKALGSALTHPSITTDFSEALLEFITPPSHQLPDVLQSLDHVHRFCYQNLGNEYLWPASMPCMLSRDEDVPVGLYGNSNSGRMKTVYRQGLGHRYGRLMQTIAGIHYNFSMPDAFWALLRQQEGSALGLKEYKTKRYFDLIRNFRRNFWLLIYLFGASPAVCKSFLGNRPHKLQAIEGDPNSFYSPYATSLRMGDLGYQSGAQESMTVCYNNLTPYVDTLCQAINRPYPAYESIGVKDTNGDYRQLNTSLLQIENEFYSPIRPKRTAHSGETALSALCNRGVEYIEVRCLDLNPYEPLGVNLAQLHFIDIFLVYCVLQDSPPTQGEENDNILENQRRVVYQGRDPKLMLLTNDGELSLPEWSHNLLNQMEPIAGLLDSAYRTDAYADSLRQQKPKLNDPDLTPSGRILKDMATKGETFFRFTMNQALQHSEHFDKRPLDTEAMEHLVKLASQSHKDQEQVEANDDMDFETYLDKFYQQYSKCS